MLRQPTKISSGHLLWVVLVIFELHDETLELCVIPAMARNMDHIAMRRLHDTLGQAVQVTTFFNPKVQVAGVASSLKDGRFFSFILQPAIEFGVCCHKCQRPG